MALENILSQEIVQKLGWTLLHFVWQAVAVTLLLGILLAVLRKSSANLRYIVACAAMGLIVLLPIATMQLVSVSIPQPLANTELPPAPVIVTMQPITEETPQASVVEYEEPVQPESFSPAPAASWKQRAADRLEPALPYLVSGWLFGVFGLSLWHLGGWAQLQRLRKKMVRKVDDSVHNKLRRLSEKLQVKRAVQLLESALVQVPTVVGWLRPVILLPASVLTGLSSEQLEALLAHELAHIRRYDYLINMLQTIVETLGFYHPAVWLVSHRIRIERENCCDDLAVSISGDRVRYARALTLMEEIRTGRNELAVAATGGSLFSRIRRLVNKESTDGSRAGWIPFVITILLIAIISVPTTIALTTKYKTQEPQQETDVMGNVKPESAKWENIGGIFPADFNDTKVLTEHINLSSIGQDCEGKVFITCILDSAQSSVRRHRFVLVQKSGNILEPSGYTTFSSENKLQEKFGFNAPFLTREIEGFRFQIRPLPLAGIDDSLPQLLVGNFTTIKQGKFMPYKLAPPGRYAIELDGIDDYLLVPDSPSLRLEAPFTVEMWIKTNLPADPNQDYWGWAVLSKGFHVGTPRVWVTGFGITLNRNVPQDPSQLLIEYSTANHSGLFTMPYGTASKLKNGKSDWIHISHVFNGENYKSAPGQPLVIGKFLIPTTSPLMGQIGEIRIWNGARTREQIRRYENVALTGNEPDLAAWWPFEQKEGQFAYDMSGNNNHARLGSSSEPDDADPKWIDLEADPGQADRNTNAPVESKNIDKSRQEQTSAPSNIGPIGQHALVFDGVDDCMYVPASPTLQFKPPFTIEMWIKPDFSEIERIKEPGEKFTGLSLMRKGKKIHDEGKIQAGGFAMYVDSSSRPEDSSWGSLYLGTEGGLLFQEDLFVGKRSEMGQAGWIHVSMSGRRSEMYVPVPDEPLVIGEAIKPPNLVRFKGQIADIRVWNRLFTRSYPSSYTNAALTGSEPNLIACWDFEHAEGQMVYDISPNRNHAYMGTSPDADSADPKWIDLEVTTNQADRNTNAPVESKSSDKSRQGQTPVPNVPKPAESVASAGVDKSIVKIDLPVVEVSSDTKLDRETTIKIKNLLGGKITIPDSPASADLLRKTVGATSPVKDESTGDKRVTQMEFNTLFDLLVSRGYVKILMNPTLEVVDGETVKILSGQKIPLDRATLPPTQSDNKETKTEYVDATDSIHITPHVSKDGNIILLQVEAAFSSITMPHDDEKTPVVNRHEISTQIRLSHGESGIIGVKQAELITEPDKAARDLKVTATEIFVILTPTIVGTVTPSLAGGALPGFQELGISVRPDDLKDRKILLCFWDMNQRPSRNLISELAKREKELAGKNVAVLLVDTSVVEPAQLKEWLDNRNIPFTCGSIKDNADDVLFRWGVRAQPWLILTDENRIVRAEGFSLEQLDEKLRETGKPAAARTRIVHFPDDRTVGNLKLRDTRPDIDWGRGYLSRPGWALLGPTRGDASVPAGEDLRLEVSGDVTDFSFLSDLKPNDLQVLMLSNKKISDEDLAYIKGLTGLVALSLDSTPIEGAGLAHLAALTSLKDLSLFNTKVSDAGLEHLSSLKSLKRLSLFITQVRGPGLKCLQNLTSLVLLDLAATPITDEYLVHVAEITWLKELQLQDTDITNKGLAHLKSLRSLEMLILGNTNLKQGYSPITDDGLVYIKGLDSLRDLHLLRTRVTDAGLVYLSNLKTLEFLDLKETRITGEGLAYLKDLPALTYLNLEQTGVAGSALKYLKEMTNLRVLLLDGENINEKDLKDLEKALPGCKVTVRTANSTVSTSEVPVLSKSAAPSAVDKVTVKVDLAVVEVSSGSTMDWDATMTALNLLGKKVALPGATTATDLLRKAAGATGEVKNDSAGDKRLTQEQFKTLFDILVSRGYVKILMRPTLEVVEGQTAQIKNEQNSLEVTANAVKDDIIYLTVKADLSSQLVPEGEGQKPMTSTRSFASFVRISSGQSQIIGGMVQMPARPDADTKSSQTSAGELMCIVTTSIIAPAAEEPMTRVYDIYDLVLAGARISRGAVDVKMDISGVGMGGQVNIPDQAIVNEARKIVNLIMQTIDPNSWFQNNPNAIGTITPFPAERPRKLAIYQTLHVHQQIKKFLLKQREQTYKTQISIELRYLYTNAEFLDEVRDSMDIEFTSDTFLDDKQVETLLRASQKKRDTRSLTAPGATVFNNETVTFSIARHTFLSFLNYSESDNRSQRSPPESRNMFCRITPHIEDNKNIIIDFVQDIPGLWERVIHDRRGMMQSYADTIAITNQRIPNNKTFTFACDIIKFDPYRQRALSDEKKTIIVLIKPTIIVQEERPRSKPAPMILTPLHLKGDTTEQSNDTILLKPGRQKDCASDKGQIMFDIKILTASDEFLKYIGFDTNSVANSKGWADYLIHSTEDSASFVIDQLHSDLLLRNVAARMRTNKDIQMLHKPQVLALSGKKFEIHITDSEHYMLIGGPPDSYIFSVEPESESNRIELGTTIRLIPTLTPDGKDIELDFEWEYRRLRGVKEHTGLDGKVQKVPQIDVDSIKTPCTIPDGKTLLIAGKKIIEQKKKKPGKPGLADMPLIGRFFYSPSQPEQTRNLLIMVTPSTDIKAPSIPQSLQPLHSLVDPNDPLIKQLEEKFKR